MAEFSYTTDDDSYALVEKSNCTHINETIDYDEPQIALATIAGIVFLSGFLANVGVFLVVAKTRSLQRINSVLQVSLAVADFLRVILLGPNFIIFLVSGRRAYHICLVYHGFHVSLTVATVLHLSAIGIERVFIITQPLVYQRLVTTRKMVLSLVVLWSVSFTYGFLQLLWFRPGKYPFDPNTATVCEYEPRIGFAIFDVFMFFVCPLVCLSVSYCRIFCIVQSQIKRINPTISEWTIERSETLGNELTDDIAQSRRTSLRLQTQSATNLYKMGYNQPSVGLPKVMRSHSTSKLQRLPSSLSSASLQLKLEFLARQEQGLNNSSNSSSFNLPSINTSDADINTTNELKAETTKNEKDDGRIRPQLSAGTLSKSSNFEVITECSTPKERTVSEASDKSTAGQTPSCRSSVERANSDICEESSAQEQHQARENGEHILECSSNNKDPDSALKTNGTDDTEAHTVINMFEEPTPIDIVQWIVTSPSGIDIQEKREHHNDDNKYHEHQVKFNAEDEVNSTIAADSDNLDHPASGHNLNHDQSISIRNDVDTLRHKDVIQIHENEPTMPKMKFYISSSEESEDDEINHDEKEATLSSRAEMYIVATEERNTDQASVMTENPADVIIKRVETLVELINNDVSDHEDDDLQQNYRSRTCSVLTNEEQIHVAAEVDDDQNVGEKIFTQAEDGSGSKEIEKVVLEDVCKDEIEMEDAAPVTETDLSDAVTNNSCASAEDLDDLNRLLLGVEDESEDKLEDITQYRTKSTHAELAEKRKNKRWRSKSLPGGKKKPDDEESEEINMSPTRGRRHTVASKADLMASYGRNNDVKLTRHHSTNFLGIETLLRVSTASVSSLTPVDIEHVPPLPLKLPGGHDVDEEADTDEEHQDGLSEEGDSEGSSVEYDLGFMYSDKPAVTEHPPESVGEVRTEREIGASSAPVAPPRRKKRDRTRKMEESPDGQVSAESKPDGGENVEVSETAGPTCAESSKPPLAPPRRRRAGKSINSHKGKSETVHSSVERSSVKEGSEPLEPSNINDEADVRLPRIETATETLEQTEVPKADGDSCMTSPQRLGPDTQSSTLAGSVVAARETVPPSSLTLSPGTVPSSLTSPDLDSPLPRNLPPHMLAEVDLPPHIFDRRASRVSIVITEASSGGSSRKFSADDKPEPKRHPSESSHPSSGYHSNENSMAETAMQPLSALKGGRAEVRDANTKRGSVSFRMYNEEEESPVREEGGKEEGEGHRNRLPSWSLGKLPPSARHTRVWARQHFNIPGGEETDTLSRAAAPRLSRASLISSRHRRRGSSSTRVSDNKAVRMTLIVVGTLVLTWLPYEITFIMKRVNQFLVSPLAWNITNLLLFSSTALNPFVYNFYSSEFRRAMKRILLCRDTGDVPWA